MANVTYTVQNKDGSYDGDMVIKQYTSMTINSGDTVTVDQPCRGMFIYVQGDCTINGSLTMTNRGAYADPTTSGGSDSNAVGANGLQLGFITTGGSESFTNDGTGFNGCGTAVRTALANHPNLSSDGTIFSISRDGANGGGGSGYGSGGWGGHGGAGGSSGTTGAATISTGGGGAGGGWHGGDGGGSAVTGSGAKGSCWSGGSGGGGACEDNGSCTAGSATAYGGPGGSGVGAGLSAGGHGAGNPGPGGQNGTGGLLYLIVGGDLTIGASGSITAHGRQAASANSNDGGAGGGSSGAGAIMIIHAGTYTNNGSVTANSTAGGASVGGHSRSGGTGGAGGVHVAQVIY